MFSSAAQAPRVPKQALQKRRPAGQNSRQQRSPYLKDQRRGAAWCVAGGESAVRDSVVGAQGCCYLHVAKRPQEISGRLAARLETTAVELHFELWR